MNQSRKAILKKYFIWSALYPLAVPGAAAVFHAVDDDSTTKWAEAVFGHGEVYIALAVAIGVVVAEALATPDRDGTVVIAMLFTVALVGIWSSQLASNDRQVNGGSLVMYLLLYLVVCAWGAVERLKRRRVDLARGSHPSKPVTM